jgi:hypothetical protein
MSYHTTYDEYKKHLDIQQSTLSILKDARAFISDSGIGSHEEPLIQIPLRVDLLQRMDNLILNLSKQSEQI